MRRLLAPLFFLTACSTPAPTIALGPELSKEQVQAVYEAADTWNRVSNQPITFPGTAEYTLKLQWLNPTWAGSTNVDSHMVYIRPGLSLPYFKRIVTHEFGHVLGLGHVAAGVMSETNPQDTLSPDDIEECKRVGACD